MGKILTGNNLKFIATHRQEIEPYNGGVYFCFDTIANGTEAYQILRNRLSSDIRSIKYGIDKRDFTIYFVGGETKAKEVFNQINKEVEDYRQANPEVTDPYYTDTNDPDLVSGTGSGSGIDWVTYLVIGAAVVAIVLLLWDRKKKG